jgi:hypothetical protein
MVKISSLLAPQYHLVSKRMCRDSALGMRSHLITPKPTINTIRTYAVPLYIVYIWQQIQIFTLQVVILRKS